MHYYLIKQDRRITTAPIIKNYSSGLYSETKLKGKTNILYIKNDKAIDFIDFIDAPLLLISDSFKNILEKYSPSLEYKAVVLTEPERGIQQVYWNVELPVVECLSPKTEYYLNGLIKRIVVKRQLAGDFSMFQIINKIEKYYIIKLELAESVLRRGMGGFILEELEEEP